jgi:predicted nucleotidyltransferase component of viral defense system
MVEIANDRLLGRELAMRGGTCLHKLHLPQPLRYSDDLDYVRCTEGGIGRYLDALRAIGTAVGLEEHGRQFSEQMVHMVFDTASTDGQRRIRIRIETNTRETKPCFERVTRPYRVDSRWWSGEAEINTFTVDELMGTKLRALYQRSKGRDLFDLWRVLAETDAENGRIVDALHHYMGDGVFSFGELAENLAAKLNDPGFRDDLAQLVTEPPSDYELAAAADLVMERLGSRLANAPGLEDIEGGRWRQ